MYKGEKEIKPSPENLLKRSEDLFGSIEGYHYEFIGDPKNSKTISGFIAPALGVSQEAIKTRSIPRLEAIAKEHNVCFAYPVYDDGHIIVEPKCDENKTRKDYFTPAILPETGLKQFLDFQRLNTRLKNNGQEAIILPMMGGSGGENIIPIIHKYFDENPDQADSSFKIFGFSNSSNFAILGASNYCRYISSPHSLVFKALEMGNNHCKDPAQQMALLLQGQMEDLDIYQTPILHDPKTDNNLEDKSSLENLNGQIIYHYPLNRGVLDRRHLKSEKYDSIIHNWLPKQENWSFALEGFIEECAISNSKTFDIELNNGKTASFPRNHFKIDHATTVRDFISDTHNKGNPPKFIELGIIAPSLGAESYYLAHDENGLMAENDYNIKRMQREESPPDSIRIPDLVPVLKEIVKTKYSLQKAINQAQKDDDRNLDKLRDLQNKIVDIPQEIEESLTKTDYQISDQHAKLLIQMERQSQKSLQDELVELAKEFKIPVTLNTRFGHVADHNVVNSGANFISIDKDSEGRSTLTMEMPEQRQKRLEAKKEKPSPNFSPQPKLIKKRGESERIV